MSYARALLIVAAITGLCVALRDHLTLVDVAMLLLLGVVAVAARYHRGPSLLSCLASIAAFDFLFVPPYYSFQVHETGYLLTFAVMLVVALTMSRLTGVIREHALESERRGRQASAIAAMITELAGAGSCGSVLEFLVRHINRTVPGEACALTAQQLDGSAGEWEPVARDLLGSLPESAAARMAVETGHSTGPGTGRCDDSDLLIVPLRVGAKSLGLVAIRPAPAAGIPAPDALATAEALAAEGAIALERALLAEQNEQARAEAQAERLRTSLLSSLSHDFRTPLATIEGAASGLLEENNGLTAEGRQDLAETILAESHRMTRMVHNLLNMIRVETGALAVQKSWQPLEEALGVALLRLDEPLKAHAVSVELPPDLPLVPIDELLDRAGVHQPARECRQVHAARHSDRHQRLPPRCRGPHPGGGRWSRDPSRVGGDGVQEVLPGAGATWRGACGRGRSRTDDLAWDRHRARRQDVGRAPRGRGRAVPVYRPARPGRRLRPFQPHSSRCRRMADLQPLVLVVEDEPQMRRFLGTRCALAPIMWWRSARPGRHSPRRRDATRISSFSIWVCPTATGWRSPGRSVGRHVRRSSCSPRGARSGTRSRPSTSGRTTT